MGRTGRGERLGRGLGHDLLGLGAQLGRLLARDHPPLDERTLHRHDGVAEGLVGQLVGRAVLGLRVGGRVRVRPHDVGMKMAQRKRQWPAFSLPHTRGTITAVDVLRATPGEERDRAIDSWCASVWDAFSGNREVVVRLLAEYGL